MSIRRMLLVAGLLAACVAGAVSSAPAANDTALRLTNVSGTSTGYVRVPNDAAFSLQRFTIEAWVMRVGAGYGMTTDGSGASVIAKPGEGSVGSDIASWHLQWTNNGQILFNLTHAFGSSGVYVASTAVPTPLARHHLAVTFDGSTVQLYVDGVPDASIAWTLGAVYYGANDVLIGADNFGAGYLRRFDGYVDDVRVWDHARTPSQIANAMSCRLTGSEPGLVAYWPFDGDTLRDATGHGHDGTGVATAGALAYAALSPLGACTAGVEDGAADGASHLEVSLFPQPARDQVTVGFDLPRPGRVSVEVLDVAGRRLAVWDAGDASAGHHEVTRSLSALASRAAGSGVVFVRVRAGGESAARTLVLRR